MKLVADRMGIDIFEVVDAAATKPFGFTPYYPGPGIGGHCIPIDPFYLSWKASEFGIHAHFIELAGEINARMPDYVVDKVVDALNDVRKPVRGSRVLILGLAYKPNVDDWRDAPAFAIMEQLRAKGAELVYSDPHVPIFPDESGHDFKLTSVELTPATLERVDAVVLTTQHRAYDYELIQRHARLIVDTRGRFARDAANVVRA
jgi:UDP-N-acetyl-D-glucosamine dehydrogenase